MADSAILRFAETLRPVKDSQADWVELFKVNFNSKTKFMLKASQTPMPRALTAAPPPRRSHVSPGPASTI